MTAHFLFLAQPHLQILLLLLLLLLILLFLLFLLLLLLLLFMLFLLLDLVLFINYSSDSAYEAFRFHNKRSRVIFGALLTMSLMTDPLKIYHIEILFINQIQLSIVTRLFATNQLNFIMNCINFMRTIDTVDIIEYMILIILIFLRLTLNRTTFRFLSSDGFQPLIAFLVFVETSLITGYLFTVTDFVEFITFLHNQFTQNIIQIISILTT